MDDGQQERCRGHDDSSRSGEGFGHHGRLDSAHFFELTDQPLKVMMAVTAEEAGRLFDRLKAEGVHLFYVKSAVELGICGEER